ncbi:MAG: WYL domain-containing protein [Proteobacteria bacterium]|nr:MAG: WYL domain-containing protein [Pseudomonadota bacterium]
MPKTDNRDTLLRHWHLLKALPGKPPGITTREATNYLRDLGYSTDIRTTQRDLVKLKSVMAIACNKKGKPYGWYWQPGMGGDIPALDISDALTLHLLGNRLQNLVPESMMRVFSGRIEQARKQLSEHRGNWHNKVGISEENLGYVGPALDNDIFEQLKQALIDNLQIQVKYQSLQEPVAKDFILHPLALVLRGVRTYLIARTHDAQNDEVMPYAAHRFKSVRVLKNKKANRKNFKLKECLDSDLMQFGVAEPIDLQLKLDQVMFKILKETPLTKNQKLIPQQDGGLLEIQIRDSWSLKWWILSKSEHVEVLKPLHYRRKIAGILMSAAKKY